MQIMCTSALVATQVQSVLRTQGVLEFQFSGPHFNDPRDTVIVQQKLSVDKEPAIRREIYGIGGATIVG
jgi:hypothetical protein